MRLFRKLPLLLLLLVDLNMSAQRLRRPVSMAHATHPTPVILDCQDADALTRRLQGDGYHARRITDHIVTAIVPRHQVEQLATISGVRFVNTASTNTLHMNKARQACRVNQILAGTGLETPFTGKGILIVDIDPGFEYDHPAFIDADGQSRAAFIWDRSHYADTLTVPVFDPTQFPTGSDPTGDWHGTHVLSIAAGSRIAGMPYHGVAPEASLGMISSSLIDAEILEDLAFVDSFAQARHTPYVVNMSFGSQEGGHDGQDLGCLTLSNLAQGPGKAFVTSSGNDGTMPIHATHTFASDKDTAKFVFNSTGTPDIIAYITSQVDDSTTHFTYCMPVVFDTATGHIVHELDTAALEANYDRGINPYSGKEYYEYQIMRNQHTLTGNQRFGLAAVGHAGERMDMWTVEHHGNISNSFQTFVKGDSECSLASFPASAEHVVTVGSVNTRNSFTNLTGATFHDSNIGPLGEASSFSSYGPTFTHDPKPTIAAPGALVVAAYNKWADDYDNKQAEFVAQVQHNGAPYYYTINAGTSMSSPFVAGVIALWLEAYPQLTQQQILEILHDNGQPWNPQTGYGLIDAYKGLQSVLRLSAAGIADLTSPLAPVTLKREQGQVRVLFNISTREAILTVADTSGRIVGKQTLSDISAGDEHQLSLQGLPRQLYILQVTTPHNRATAKILR